MPQRTWLPCTATVRIGTLKVARTTFSPCSPGAAGRTTPMAPQYTPRAWGSSWWIICMARTLGAPVTEPQGNSAANRSARLLPERLRATTSDVICHTLGNASVWNRRGTCTLKGSATRDRSLRSRSTIITFSARSFGDVRRVWACAASSAGLAPRAAVPFMGRARICPPRQSKNSSGETDSSWVSPVSTKAA